MNLTHAHQVFKWNDRYLTGLSEVDKQHRKLVTLINALGTIYAEGAEIPEILRVFDELTAYTSYHFQTEESLMDSVAMDETHERSHREAHASFIKQLNEARAQIQENAEEATSRLLSFLTSWLVFHILGVDSGMALEVKALESGRSRAEARDLAEAGRTESQKILLDALNELYGDLSERTHAYWDAYRKLTLEMADRARAEQQLARRVREMSCLYEVGRVMEQRNLSLSQALEKITEIVTTVWENTGTASVTVRTPLGDFVTGSIDEQVTPLQTALHVNGEQYGELIIRVAASGSVADTETDETLIGMLSDRISDYIAQRLAEDSLRKLSLAVEQSPVSIMITDRQGRIEYINPRFCNLTGYTAAEVLGQNASMLKSGEMGPENYAQMWKTIMSGEEWHGEFHNRRKDGTLFWEQSAITPVFDNSGEITHFLAVKEDITERKESEARLEASLAELQLHAQEMDILNTMGDLIQLCLSDDEAFRIIAQAAGRLFKHCGGALAVKAPDNTYLETVATWGNGCDSEPVFVVEECWAMRRGQQHRIGGEDLSLTCQHFRQTPEAGYLCLPMVVVGDILGVLTVTRPSDISDTQWHGMEQLAVAVAESVKLSLSNLKLREALRKQALHDGLTGLHNRRYLDETLPRELHRALREQEPLAVAIIDIDHFKRYNDEHGHETGDAVLCAVAAVLSSGMRRSDLAARYGGEEFVLVMYGMSLEDAAARLNALRGSLRLTRLESEGKRLPHVTFSAGLACAPEHGIRQEDLLRAADEALYEAKHAGRDRVVLYSAE